MKPVAVPGDDLTRICFSDRNFLKSQKLEVDSRNIQFSNRKIRWMEFPDTCTQGNGDHIQIGIALPGLTTYDVIAESPDESV